MRISKKTREEAIVGCEGVGGMRLRRVDTDTREFADDDAEQLGWAAMRAVDDGAHGAHDETDSIHDQIGFQWLEAAALLRDGWSPGDPVYLLRSR